MVGFVLSDVLFLSLYFLAPLIIVRVMYSNELSFMEISIPSFLIVNMRPLHETKKSL